MMSTTTIVKKDRAKIIVSTSQKLFAKNGLSNTTMEDIAIGSAMGTGSIYYYFKSKEEIFEAVIEKEGRTLQSTIIAAVSTATGPQEKIKTFITTRMAEIKKLSNYYRVLHDEYKQNFSIVERARLTYDVFEITLLSNILQEGVDIKKFVIADVTLTAEMIIASLKGVEEKWSRNLSIEDINYNIKQLLKILFKGIEIRI